MPARHPHSPGYRVAVKPVTGEADTRPPEEIACWEAGRVRRRHSHRKDIKEALIG